MGYFGIFMLAVGLSADAFAVSVCKGLTAAGRRRAVQAGLWFGGFQALMPLLGAFLGGKAGGFVKGWGSLCAGVMLTVIGIMTFAEGFSDGDEESGSLSWREMLPAALATSVDAFAVGMTFPMLKTEPLPASAVIGAVTFSLSCLGVRAGGLLGGRSRRAARMAGGAVLAVIGLKTALF